MDISDYLEKDGNKSYIKVKVIPNSQKDEFFSIMDDKTLKIRIKQKAENGKANKSLISFISKELGVSEKNIKILSGASSRIKILRVDF